jgi:hypothetical protein
MQCSIGVRASVLVAALLSVLYSLFGVFPAEAGDWPVRRRVYPAGTYYRRTSAISPGPLGTFAPTPMLMVRGDAPTGSGYSPLGQSGDTTMAIYGPTSPFRATAAPVLTYVRGYDGTIVAVPGSSFSTPNLPTLSSVVYPTQSTNYFGPRVLTSPPWWASGANWIDQN